MSTDFAFCLNSLSPGGQIYLCDRSLHPCSGGQYQDRNWLDVAVLSYEGTVLWDDTCINQARYPIRNEGFFCVWDFVCLVWLYGIRFHIAWVASNSIWITLNSWFYCLHLLTFCEIFETKRKTRSWPVKKDSAVEWAEKEGGQGTQRKGLEEVCQTLRGGYTGRAKGRLSGTSWGQP